MDDHKNCQHRCQYSLETSEFPFPRVCAHGECCEAVREQCDKHGITMEELAQSERDYRDAATPSS